MTSPFARIAAARGEEVPKPRHLHAVDNGPTIPESSARRPTLLADVIGQPELTSQLRTHINYGVRRSRPPGHVLLDGPSGYGKTSFARAIHGELIERGITSRLITVMPNAVPTTDKLAVQFAQLQANDVLFLDEIHGFKQSVQEGLYTAMEDRYVVTSSDNGAQVVPLPPFTLVAGTTEPAKILAPLRGRFDLTGHLTRYAEEDLALLLQSHASESEVTLTDDAALVIAEASRFTPRTAIKNLGKVRAYAEELTDAVAPSINEETARDGLEYAGIDAFGLDERDRRVLRALAVQFKGGPIGLIPLATALGMSPDELRKDIEPYLIAAGLVELHGRGRQTTRKTYHVLGLRVPPLMHAWR